MRRRIPVILLVAVFALAGGCRERMGLSPGTAYDGAWIVPLDSIRFDDGDTFYLSGKPIRVLGIDTPETASPGVGIMTDQPFGRAAADTTRALMTRARQIEVAFDGRDTYGRQLAHVFVDGELLAVKLLERGLAYETVSHFGDNGFPDLADRIIDASVRGPKPAFEEPYKWRREHQKRR